MSAVHLPHTQLGSDARGSRIRCAALPIVVRGGDVGAGSNEQLNHLLVAGACRLDERSLPAACAAWLRSDGGCLGHSGRSLLVVVLRVEVVAGSDK